MIPKNDEERRHTLISQITTLEHGLAMFSEISDKIKVLEDKPLMINTEIVKDDFRYVLGFKDALRWVLDRPQRAIEILNEIKE